MTKSRGTVIAVVAAAIAIAAVYLFFPIYRPARQTTERAGPPAGALPPAAAAEAKTAAAHASFASEGTSVSYVREHLGHVILCLEGSNGPNVHAAWENPCAGQGDGVLNELGSAGPSWNLVVHTADNLAVKALRSDDLAEMKIAARGVAALMKLLADAF